MTKSVGFLGADMPGLRPRFEVEEGAYVKRGQVVFRDRKQPEIAYVSPIPGTVSSLEFGQRRTLSACIIEADTSEPVLQDTAPLGADSLSSPRKTLLERGMWPAFRTRPFGRTPAPEAVPDAIFVNAVRTTLHAPDPYVVLEDQIDAFRLGTSILTKLTDGHVFVCQPPGDTLGPSQDRVTFVSFSGTVAAGLAGTHVNRLYPVSSDRSVWTIGYQDVAAIGHLFQTGRYMPERVVSIGGRAADRPRLVKTCLGDNIADICGADTALALSGDPYSGRDAMFLGRFHDQITLVPKSAQSPKATWLSRHFPVQRALIPTQALEHALAVDILPVPLLRALSIGDIEAAERLGCLALIEEDVAALSRQCTSGADYGVLLRQVLDDLMAEAA